MQLNIDRQLLNIRGLNLVDSSNKPCRFTVILNSCAQFLFQSGHPGWNGSFKKIGR